MLSLHLILRVMTKILLLSDTHGHMDERILTYAREADQIWHAGDIGDLSVTDALKDLKPVRAVYGNIDGALVRREFPLDNRFTCEGVDIWITHIGGYPGRYQKRVREVMQKVQYDKKFDLLHMNPGACGKAGFHKVRTMLRFAIDGKEIRELEVVELGKRG